MTDVGKGQRVWKTRSWADNWNNVIRYVIFQDSILKEMMMIPEADKKDILRFISKYFIRDAMPDELLTDENVRVVYSEIEGGSMGVPQVRRRYIIFDIYVKEEHQHNYDKDRLKNRTQLISDRIRYLLTKDKFVQHMSFTAVDDFDVGTRVVGYSRYELMMEYKKTY